MSVLLLVRHGQASWGEADYDRLSPRGVEQSRLLGAALAGRAVRPDVVLRGSLRRHKQTADAAIEGAGWEVPVVEDAGWDEFDHMSTLAGTIEFFVATPSSMMTPIIEKMFSDSRVIASARKDPQNASGRASMMVSGVTNDS